MKIVTLAMVVNTVKKRLLRLQWQQTIAQLVNTAQVELSLLSIVLLATTVQRLILFLKEMDVKFALLEVTALLELQLLLHAQLDLHALKELNQLHLSLLLLVTKLHQQEQLLYLLLKLQLVRQVLIVLMVVLKLLVQLAHMIAQVECLLMSLNVLFVQQEVTVQELD